MITKKLRFNPYKTERSAVFILRVSLQNFVADKLVNHFLLAQNP